MDANNDAASVRGLFALFWGSDSTPDPCPSSLDILEPVRTNVVYLPGSLVPQSLSRRYKVEHDQTDTASRSPTIKVLRVKYITAASAFDGEQAGTDVIRFRFVESHFIATNECLRVRVKAAVCSSALLIFARPSWRTWTVVSYAADKGRVTGRR